MAVEVLKEKGVPEHRILFLNLIASPSGVAEFAERFPKLRVVTAFIDQGLDEKKYTRRHNSWSISNDTNELIGISSLVLEISVTVITRCSANRSAQNDTRKLRLDAIRCPALQA